MRCCTEIMKLSMIGIARHRQCNAYACKLQKVNYCTGALNEPRALAKLSTASAISHVQQALQQQDHAGLQASASPLYFCV